MHESNSLLDCVQLQNNVLVVGEVERRAIVVRIVLIGPPRRMGRRILEPTNIVVQRNSRYLLYNDLLKPFNSLLLYCGIGGSLVLREQLISSGILPASPVGRLSSLTDWRGFAA